MGLQVAVVLSRLSCHLNCIIHIRSAVTWCLNKTESIPSVIEQEAGYTLEIRTAVYYGAFVDGLLQEGKVS